MHTYVYTYIHTYHKYTHTYIHTYMAGAWRALADADPRTIAAVYVLGQHPSVKTSGTCVCV